MKRRIRKLFGLSLRRVKPPQQSLSSCCKSGRTSVSTSSWEWSTVAFMRVCVCVWGLTTRLLTAAKTTLFNKHLAVSVIRGDTLVSGGRRSSRERGAATAERGTDGRSVPRLSLIHI